MNYCKMDPEAKSVWLKALRSNKYKQCKFKLALHNPNGTDSYCALGILVNELGTGDWELPDKKDCWRYYSEGKRSYAVSEPPAEFDKFMDPLAYDQIMAMNDGMGKSFAEIADWIEENL